MKSLFKPVGSPGVRTHRRYGTYNPFQEALWQGFDDTYHSAAFGFHHTRYPPPTEEIDPERFPPWQQKVLQEWGKESQRDSLTRGPEEASLPQHLWHYLYTRMVAATPLKGEDR
jgi:hypothetical protein